MAKSKKLYCAYCRKPTESHATHHDILDCAKYLRELVDDLLAACKEGLFQLERIELHHGLEIQAKDILKAAIIKAKGMEGEP